MPRKSPEGRQQSWLAAASIETKRVEQAFVREEDRSVNQVKHSKVGRTVEAGGRLRGRTEGCHP
jgi:hypothetical protein